jgi:hypothetical protein
MRRRHAYTTPAGYGCSLFLQDQKAAAPQNFEATYFIIIIMLPIKP